MQKRNKDGVFLPFFHFLLFSSLFPLFPFLERELPEDSSTERNTMSRKEDKFYYEPGNSGGLGLGDWAKNKAYEIMMEGRGPRNARFFHSSILNEHGRPVLSESYWAKILQQIRNGKFVPVTSTSSGLSSFFFFQKKK